MSVVEEKVEYEDDYTFDEDAYIDEEQYMEGIVPMSRSYS